MRRFLITFLIFSLIGIAVAVAGAFYFYQQLQAVAPGKMERTTFAIPKGQSVALIGQRLQEAGLIHSGLVFRIVVWHEDLAQKIQAGSFFLSPAMSTEDVANQLTQGTNDQWITILEGWRTEEIAEFLDNQHLENFDKKTFLDLSKNDEGYLFPDSYLIQKTATAETIHNLLRDTFDKKVAKGLAPDLHASSKSLADIITMASVIQREAKDYQQMQIVSSILWNRVKIGMALDADSTLQYVKGYDPILKTWWPEPLAIDKESTSPYNTYKYPGLPPGPIANPGLDAIKAALHPIQSNYLYYIHDAQGHLHYATTLQEQDANIQKYLNQ